MMFCVNALKTHKAIVAKRAPNINYLNLAEQISSGLDATDLQLQLSICITVESQKATPSNTFLNCVANCIIAIS